MRGRGGGGGVEGDTEHVGNYLEHSAVLTWQNPIKATHFFNSPGRFL